MPLTQESVRRVFEKLDLERVSCAGHRGGFVVIDGVRILAAHLHARERRIVSDTVVHLLRKSLKLSEPEFRALVTCTLTRDDFVSILRSRGHIPESGASG